MKEASKSKKYLRRWVKDLASCLTITVLVLAIVIVLAKTGLSWNAVMKLIGFFGFTLVLFGYFISDSRSWWKKRSYWALTSLFLSVHSISYAIVLTHMETFKPIWFGLITLPEMAVFFLCRNWLMLRKPRFANGPKNSSEPSINP